MTKLLKKAKKSLLPRLSNLVLKSINKTLSYQVENETELNQYSAKRPVIIAIWHDQLWYPSYYLRQRDYVALADISRLGDCISYVLNNSGFKVVRGSTSRSGSSALRKLLRELKQGATLTVTPDGPRGPRHQVKPGIIYLAQLTDAVIIPLGIAYNRCFSLKTWDQFMIPYPFTKAGLYFGPAIDLESDRERLVEYQELISRQLDQASEQAREILKER